VVAPLGEARSNQEVFGQLARAMGCATHYDAAPEPSTPPPRGPVAEE
jgi:hypothetical protein